MNRTIAFAMVLAGLLMVGFAHAHPGGMSPKDGCHKHKAAGERHWHIEGTAKRGGICKGGKQIGNCAAMLDAYDAERRDRHGSWEAEGMKARAALDCLRS